MSQLIVWVCRISISTRGVVILLLWARFPNFLLVLVQVSEYFNWFAPHMVLCAAFLLLCARSPSTALILYFCYFLPVQGGLRPLQIWCKNISFITVLFRRAYEPWNRFTVLPCSCALPLCCNTHILCDHSIKTH